MSWVYESKALTPRYKKKKKIKNDQGWGNSMLGRSDMQLCWDHHTMEFRRKKMEPEEVYRLDMGCKLQV